MSLVHCAGSAEPYPHWLFTAASGDQLRVVPERGGLVTSWVADGRERLYFDADRFADPVKSVRGGIPVLFPICGNLPGDSLRLPQGEFPMVQHGFARDLPWQLERLEGGEGIRLRLTDSPASRAHYPFAFELTLDYALEPGALAITAGVEHGGTAGGAPAADAMPFALGLHPYFALSSLEAAELEGLPEQCFNHLTMAEAATAEQLLQLRQGVDLLAAPSGPVRLWDRASAEGVELQLSAPLDLAVVWTDPPRPMLCLEPWTAPRGALASGERQLNLQPGERMQLQCRYALLPHCPLG
ncbi:MAG: galactose mutarotase [Synechococcaceae bacterium WB8_1B_136]|nr:galactose mutarotase [Synechococcaceae bacterium WB8_1B_136]